MKIEKISENQIRCTLTSEDLARRSIKLRELAYGSDKAKSLFRDMMLQAQSECGFDSGNSPLMIEAIPMTPDSLVLIITKVEDPEELDTRFSRFSASQDEPSAPSRPKITGADDILELFQKIYEARKAAEVGAAAGAAAAAARKKENTKKKDSTAGDHAKPSAGEDSDIPVNLVQSFRFRALDDVIRAAHGLNGFYDGENDLYGAEGGYQLVLHQSESTPEEFNKVCNILSEYGTPEPFSPSAEAHLSEHGDLIVPKEALQHLSEI